MKPDAPWSYLVKRVLVGGNRYPIEEPVGAEFDEPALPPLLGEGYRRLEKEAARA